MGIYTYKQLQTRVLSNVIDTPTAVINSVPRLINAALRELQIDHNFKVMEALFEPVTTVGARNLGSVPADFKEYRGDPWFLKNDGTVSRMIAANKREDIWTAINEEDQSYPLVLLQAVETDNQGNGQFSVYPLPDGNSDYTDGEYRVKVPYWAYFDDLVNDGDTNWFTNNADLWLEYKATAEAFARNWDSNKQGIWTQMAAVEKAKVEKRDKLLRLSTYSGALVPQWRGANSPKLTW